MEKTSAAQRRDVASRRMLAGALLLLAWAVFAAVIGAATSSSDRDPLPVLVFAMIGSALLTAALIVRYSGG